MSGWESNLGWGARVGLLIKEPAPKPQGIWVSWQAWVTPQRRSPVWSSLPSSETLRWGNVDKTTRSLPSHHWSYKNLVASDCFRLCLDFHPSHKFPMLHFPCSENMRLVMLTTVSNTYQSHSAHVMLCWNSALGNVLLQGTESSGGLRWMMMFILRRY